MRQSTTLLAVAIMALAGCGGSSSKDQAGGQRTDAREARAVHDIRERYNNSREAYDALVRGCESGGVRGASLERCVSRKASPFHRAAVRQAQRGLRVLIPSVGPACARTLRAAVPGVGGPEPEPVLLDAQHACEQESGG